ncbi:MAG: histidine phosphatase family protein [Acidimicrobiales bacterium]
MPGPLVTEFLVVRHGQSLWNAEQRWQGWADPPLSALGEQQATAAGRRVAGGGRFAAVASSDLQRALRSAEIIAGIAPSPGPVEVHPGLREHDVGEWSGMDRAEIDRRWPGQVTRWRTGELSATPGGEARPAFEARLLAALGALAAAHPGQRVLTVCHGGVIRAISRRAGHQVTGVDHLAGGWFEIAGGQPVLTGLVNLLGGAVPRCDEASA